jgi:hypothetical protein
MTISRESAAVVLRLLTGAFPSPALGEDSVGLYLDRMTSPPFGDVDLLLAVAEACVDELDRMPTLHQLLVAYQGAARGKIAQRMAADQRALERAGATSGGPRPDEGYGKAMVDVIRTALSEAIPAGDGARGHRHEPGVDPTVGREVYTLDGPQVVGRCPVCANADAVAEQMHARMSELLAERHVVPIPQPVKVSRCSSCGDDGVVVVDDRPESFGVKPCSACRPEATESWANSELGLRRGVTR